MSENRPRLVRGDRFSPQWECFCEFIERQQGSFNFNWSEMGKSNPRALADFRKDEELKDGALLLTCNRCRRRWLLSYPASFALLVDGDEVTRLKDWSRRDLRLTPEQQRTVQAIGAVRHKWSADDLKAVAEMAQQDLSRCSATAGRITWLTDPSSR